MSTVRIINADVMDGLAQLEDESVNCVVTSPPYWGLRDYGVDGQIGLEPTVLEFIDKLVAVFAEVRRVLRKDGTLWLNMGDCYAGGGNGARDSGRWPKQSRNDHRVEHCHRRPAPYIKAKDMVGQPWRLAFALQDDGWYLRSDIIWHKPNPMPESVEDRPTKSHEYLFLLSKSSRYYYDAEAVKEPCSENTHARGKGVNPKARLGGDHPRNVDCRYKAPGQPEHKGLRRRGLRARQNESFSAAVAGAVDNRNMRTVLSIHTQPYKGAHFATFPEALAIPCIKAGCPSDGIVLDPFGGAGTTGLVAAKLGRDAVLIELNPDTAVLAQERITGAVPLMAQVRVESLQT